MLTTRTCQLTALTLIVLLVPIQAMCLTIKNTTRRPMDVVLKHCDGTSCHVTRDLQNRKKMRASIPVSEVIVFPAGTLKTDSLSPSEIPAGGVSFGIPHDGRYIVTRHADDTEPAFQLHGTKAAKQTGEHLIKYYPVEKNEDKKWHLDETSPSLIVRKEHQDDKLQRHKKMLAKGKLEPQSLPHA